MSPNNPLHGALFPIVRQILQFVAALLLGRGVVGEDILTAVAGLVMSVGTVVWMLLARERVPVDAPPAQEPPKPSS